MDLATIVGLLVGLAALAANVLLEGGSFLALFNLPAFVLIFFGTIGATLIGFRPGDIKQLGKVIASAFKVSEDDPQEIVNHLVTMAERARREGLLALQDNIPGLKNALLARAVQLVVDGTDPEIVQQTMETQVELTEERALNLASMLDAAGGYSPTIGIIGTVMGLVKVLGNLADAEELAHSIAMAFLATFYGILFANMFWLPLANKVKQNIKQQTILNRMYVAGVTGLQTGEAPRALREKLEVYFSDAAADRTRRGGAA